MGLSDINKFCRNLLYRSRYGLTEDGCIRAILDACDFFGIPAPVMIKNMTEKPDGQTMFVNRDRESLYDDVLCYNLKELKSLGISDYTGFTLVFTHECAHRVFQNHWLPGPDFGQWEQELIADYFMGVRAGLQAMEITNVMNGLGNTHGSGTHPTGWLRKEYIQYGLFEGRAHLIKHRIGDVDEYLRLFLEYRQRHYQELRDAEMKIY